MSKTALPQLPVAEALQGIDFDIAPSARAKWNSAIVAQEDAATISIYDYIGSDGMGGGITAGRIAGALRAIGAKDVTVNINSPGGSVFEGIAIYNLLAAHPHNVTVRVIGLAASAASVIAMAGDTIEMGAASFMMIHNVLMFAIGNRHALRDAAAVMEPIDRALADLYAARTGLDAKDIAKMMDKETWFSASDAIDQGFADAQMVAAVMASGGASARNAAQARNEIQAALAKAGYSRSRQRELLKEFSGTPGAAANAVSGMPCAAGSDAHPTPGAGDEASPEKSLFKTGESKMDITKLKAEHPELFEAVSKEGFTAGIKDGTEKERARIASIDAAAVPGHEALTAQAKQSGISAADYALQVLAAEKSLREKALVNAVNDAPKPAAPAAPADGAKTIKRAEFNALTHFDQRAISASGIRVVD